ncbi:MAG: DUF3098 domain-containing protein [Sphingobacteriales bacterium]|nr:MAG: DUF3098 domain-containing protein [Sphingobacteriales bacterium]
MAKANNRNNGTSKTFLFGRENYYLMFLGLIIIVIGFMLMSGGRSSDPNVYSQDIFSFRRITLAPIVVLLGFALEVYAIMKKPKAKAE